MGILIFHSDAYTTTVFITGTNRGIGLEYAKQYKAKGYDVIAAARNPDDAVELKKLGVRIEQLDVKDPKSIESLANRLKGVPIDFHGSQTPW